MAFWTGSKTTLWDKEKKTISGHDAKVWGIVEQKLRLKSSFYPSKSVNALFSLVVLYSSIK